tara:strand:+ start:1034 stop:1750 length:717 start_codon:yes stop_codon:yes gene_type:complete
MSKIEYERTIEINYEHAEEKNHYLGYENMRRLAKELQNRGLTLRDRYSDFPTYGYIEKTEDTTQYNVFFENVLIFTTHKRYLAFEAKEAMQALGNEETAHIDELPSTKTTKEWRSVQGNYLDVDGYEYSMGRTALVGDDEIVYVQAEFHSNYGYLTLKITSSWSSERTQRDEKIKEMIVKRPLELVGLIQKRFESAIKLKKWGYETNNVEVDCNFRAMTQNESKCSPDIIKMTREARK